MATENHEPHTTGNTARRGLPLWLVWSLLTLAVAANTGASLLSMSVAVGVVFGVVALGLAALLVYEYRRRRTS